ncbi:GNAT family N-acetyltransferase [Halorarum salinum]|uniref:GNAT family N-acetyltransferase n=1 Tax=Halorarum salinum TaxID=2743089 RepID=UPI001FE35956|nr:GNAT family N-acetyltransferase [Halobaculum salinum]
MDRHGRAGPRDTALGPRLRVGRRRTRTRGDVRRLRPGRPRTGAPPADRDSVREWLTALGDGVHLLASHDGRPVGHATLVPDGEVAHELAIFVDGANRHARIGTHLLDTLLTHAGSVGVDAVWLLVERHNRPAVALYANAGFETADAWGGTMRMRLELDGPDDPPTGD